MHMKQISNHFIAGSRFSSGGDGSLALISSKRPSQTLSSSSPDSCRLTPDLRPLISGLPPPHSTTPKLPRARRCPPSRCVEKAGFSLIEVMVSAVLAVIVVWTAGTQIINVLRYHNEYRIDAMLLEDLTRVANGVQSRIEMCANWTETATGSGVWGGGFPIQVNGVAFETNRFTNVKQYQIVATNGAFVETLIRNPKEGWRTNTVTRFIANEPGFSRTDTVVAFTANTLSVDVVSVGTINPIGLIRAVFSASGEWRWAGRTYTNTVTVPRIIVLYNKN